MRSFAKSLVFLLLLGLFTSLYAADKPDINLLGFSPDGKYFAFEQFGIYDGSGYPFSQVQIIDVDKNDWVCSAFKADGESEDESLNDVRLKAIRRAMPKLRELGLDRAVQGHELFFDPESEETEYAFGYYFIKLEAVQVANEAGSDSEIFQDAFARPEKMCLTLLNAATDEKTVLQQDGDKLPKSRGRASNYRICGVYTSHDGQGIVVVLSYTTPGFEGMDKHFMVVTGPLAH